MAYLATIQLIVTERMCGTGTDANPYYTATELFTPDGVKVAEIVQHTGAATGDWHLLVAECERARTKGGE